MTLTWFLVQTTPQGQTRAIDHMGEAGFTVYCPMETIWKRTRSGRNRIQRPLLVGYLFAACPEGLSKWGAAHLEGVRGIIAPNVEPERMAGFVGAFQKRETHGEFDKTRDKAVKLAKAGPLTTPLGTDLKCLEKLLTRDRNGRLDLVASAEGFEGDDYEREAA